jgi:UDP-2-acetamido-2,6-beta-L-arabino-hexul-4-ose reductase
MLKVGITGQSGFIGTHLFNFLSLKKDEITLIPYKDEYFQNPSELGSFVKQCDTIVHLAAMNRHGDPQVIYDINLKLVNQLINACETTNSKPHILFSSSTQEEKNNLYGKSKYDGRKLFEEWARRCNSSFTGLVIPNVFGPFGNPYYNSVVATFCYQLTHGEEPHIDVDGVVKLIYAGELVELIYQKIKDKSHKTKVPLRNPLPGGGRGGFKNEKTKDNPTFVKASADAECHKTKVEEENIETCLIDHTSEQRVSEILALLNSYKENYFGKGVFPDLNDPFEKNLFNTFVCYIDHQKFFPFPLKLNSDDRGTFVETVRLNSGGQISFSTTRPGITRGNHYHTRKAERFAVIKGKAQIELRRIGTDKIMKFDLDGDNPSFVDMPVWYTHNITNTGSEDLYTIFWINEHFNAEDPDTFFEEV